MSRFLGRGQDREWDRSICELRGEAGYTVRCGRRKSSPECKGIPILGFRGAWRTRRRQERDGNDDADVVVAERNLVIRQAGARSDLSMVVQKLDRSRVTVRAGRNDDLRVEHNQGTVRERPRRGCAAPIDAKNEKQRLRAIDLADGCSRESESPVIKELGIRVQHMEVRLFWAGVSRVKPRGPADARSSACFDRRMLIEALAREGRQLASGGWLPERCRRRACNGRPRMAEQRPRFERLELEPCIGRPPSLASSKQTRHWHRGNLHVIARTR
jgi:hypothetical protein